jgi:hypothetical protein
MKDHPVGVAHVRTGRGGKGLSRQFNRKISRTTSACAVDCPDGSRTVDTIKNGDSFQASRVVQGRWLSSTAGPRLFRVLLTGPGSLGTTLQATCMTIMVMRTVFGSSGSALSLGLRLGDVR